MQQTPTLAVVVARLDDLRQDVQGLHTEVQASRTEYVSRGEWGQRNIHVDSRFDAHGREIAQLRTDVQSRRAPWWSVASILVAGAALVRNLPEPLTAK